MNLKKANTIAAKDANFPALVDLHINVTNIKISFLIIWIENKCDRLATITNNQNIPFSTQKVHLLMGEFNVLHSKNCI